MMDSLGSMNLPAFNYVPSTEPVGGQLGYREAVRQAELAALTGEEALRAAAEEVSRQAEQKMPSAALTYREPVEEADALDRLELLQIQQMLRQFYPNYSDPAYYQAQLMWLIGTM